MTVVFASQEKARACEQDPQCEEGLQEARATMADIFHGALDLVDLTVMEEHEGRQHSRIRHSRCGNAARQ